MLQQGEGVHGSALCSAWMISLDSNLETRTWNELSCNCGKQQLRWEVGLGHLWEGFDANGPSLFFPCCLLWRDWIDSFVLLQGFAPVLITVATPFFGETSVGSCSYSCCFSARSGTKTMWSAALPGSEIPEAGTAGKSADVPSLKEGNIWDLYHGKAVLIEEKQPQELGVVLWKKVECREDENAIVIRPSVLDDLCFVMSMS